MFVVSCISGSRTRVYTRAWTWYMACRTCRKVMQGVQAVRVRLHGRFHPAIKLIPGWVHLGPYTYTYMHLHEEPGMKMHISVHDSPCKHAAVFVPEWATKVLWKPTSNLRHDSNFPGFPPWSNTMFLEIYNFFTILRNYSVRPNEFMQ